SQQAKAPLKVRVQGKVSRKAARTWCANKLLLLIDDVEGKATTPVEGVSEVKLLDQRQPAPPDEMVWRIPRKRPSRLLAEDGVLDVGVEHGACSRPRASIGSEH